MTQPIGRRDERGMILVNVLVIVMLATAVLAIMLAGAEEDVDRTTMLRQAAQAMATARGAELSAIAALRRDAASGSKTDSPDEEWGRIADRDVRIDGGTFSFTVADAQSRYNINGLARGDALSQGTFAAIALELGIPADKARLIINSLQAAGPIDDLSPLRAAGLDERQLELLALYCTVLPEATPVNLNTAPEQLLVVMFANAATARSVVAQRSRPGGLNAERLLTESIVLPPGTALSSDYYWARGRVVIGETSQQLTSLLHRGSAEGKPQVRAIRRWRGAAPIMAPPLPAGPPQR